MKFKSADLLSSLAQDPTATHGEADIPGEPMGAEGEGGETKEKEKKKKAVTGAEVVGMPEGATTTGAGQQGSWGN